MKQDIIEFIIEYLVFSKYNENKKKYKNNFNDLKLDTKLGKSYFLNKKLFYSKLNQYISIDTLENDYKNCVFEEYINNL